VNNLKTIRGEEVKELERKSFKLEVKSTSVENNIGKFDGYCAIFNKLDFNGDIILPGAFKRSLDLQGNKRPLYFEHIPHELLGAGFVEEDDTGLKINGEINQDTQIGREQFSNMQKGYLDTMSIGYMTVLADFIGSTRYLKEIALWETTLTTLPAMPDARVEAKSVVPFQDLPIAPDDTVWDAPAAASRVSEWAGGPDKEKIDWGKYKKAFLWFDEANPTKFGSYKLGIGDIIEGSLKVVPKAIFAVAAVLNGARGGVDIPSDDKDKIWNQLQKYYKKMGKEMPEKASIDVVQFELKAGRTISQATAGQIQSAIDVLKGVKTLFTEISAQEISKAIETLQALLSDTGSKSLENLGLAKKEVDTLSTLIEDIKKFT